MSGEVRPFPGAPEHEVSPELLGAVEALLFSAGHPVPMVELALALDQDLQEVGRAIEVLGWKYGAPDRGIDLVHVDGGWQLQSQPRFAQVILKLRGGKPLKLSRPALEVLAVVAYRQTVTRHEIEGVRGVDSGGVLKGLLDRQLVRVSGRREEPGRPLEYATTPDFLRMFSMPSLGSLPTLKEREELMRDAEPEEE